MGNTTCGEIQSASGCLGPFSVYVSPSAATEVALQQHYWNIIALKATKANTFREVSFKGKVKNIVSLYPMYSNFYNI